MLRVLGKTVSQLSLLVYKVLIIVETLEKSVSSIRFLKLLTVVQENSHNQDLLFQVDILWESYNWIILIPNTFLNH